MSLNVARKDFLSSSQSFQLTLNWINHQGPGGVFIYDEGIRGFVVESAFLKLFIAWESFLERALLLYLLGQQPRTGVPVVSLAHPVGIDHANRMLIGTQKYVDWANPEIVSRLASLYLRDGFPLVTVLKSIQATLLDMRTVRNASAHLSTTTKRALDTVTQREVAKVFTRSPVSEFLLHPHPTKLPLRVVDSYLQELDTASKLIVEPDP